MGIVTWDDVRLDTEPIHLLAQLTETIASDDLISTVLAVI